MLELNPDLVTYGEIESRTSSSQVFYAGIPVPDLFRTPETGAGARTAKYYLAREIEQRLEKMSAHQRLQFYAASGRLKIREEARGQQAGQRYERFSRTTKFFY